MRWTVLALLLVSCGSPETVTRTETVHEVGPAPECIEALQMMGDALGEYGDALQASMRGNTPLGDVLEMANAAGDKANEAADLAEACR